MSNMIDDFQIFVMNSFKGSALIGDIVDKKWIFDHAYLLAKIPSTEIEEKINVAINELILSGFLDKNLTITESGIAVFCPLKKSSIKIHFVLQFLSKKLCYRAPLLLLLLLQKKIKKGFLCF